MDWANTAAPADVQYPAAGVEAAGYANNDPFPHEEANGIFARISEHISWLREIFPGAGTAKIDESVIQVAFDDPDPVELQVSGPVSNEQQVTITSPTARELYLSGFGYAPPSRAAVITSIYEGIVLTQENLCKASGTYRLAGAASISAFVLDAANLGSMSSNATFTDAWEIPVSNNTSIPRGQISVTIGYHLDGTDIAAVGAAPLNATACWDDTNKKIILNLYLWNSTSNDWDAIPPGASTILNPGGTVNLEIEVHVEVK